MRRKRKAQKFHRKCKLLRSTRLCQPRPFTSLCSAQSTITNKSRLKLLQKREEVLQQIFAAVRDPSVPFYKSSSRYEQFLEGTITESFLYILEPSVGIYCRNSDVDLVRQAAENAAKAYKEISGREIEFAIEGSISDDA